MEKDFLLKHLVLLIVVQNLDSSERNACEWSSKRSLPLVAGCALNAVSLTAITRKSLFKRSSEKWFLEGNSYPDKILRSKSQTVRTVPSSTRVADCLGWNLKRRGRYSGCWLGYIIRTRKGQRWVSSFQGYLRFGTSGLSHVEAR